MSFALATALFTAGMQPPSAQAAGIEKKKEEGSRSSSGPLLSKKVYDQLTKAQEYVEAKKYNEALNVLKQVEGMSSLNSTEIAQVLNFYAFIYFSQENYPKAIGAYEKLLQQPDLQPAVKGSSLYTLSQLYFVTENYKKALATVKDWMALSESPGPDAYALLGQAYYKLEQYKDAIPSLKKAIELQKAAGKEVKENWYLLLRATYYELKDYENMIAVLQELINLNPKPQYIRDLAGAYSQVNDTKKQLALMEVMYEQRMLDSEAQVRNLASLYLMHEVPYKAAKVLEKGIADGLITQDKRNLSLLSQAWMQSREDQKALAPLRKAAEMSGDGELWVRLGQAHASLDQWKEAIEALKTGLRSGGVKREGAAQILLGMSYYNLKMLAQAKSAFEAAANSGGKSKDTAAQWIKYIDNEMEREEALKQS